MHRRHQFLGNLAHRAAKIQWFDARIDELAGKIAAGAAKRRGSKGKGEGTDLFRKIRIGFLRDHAAHAVADDHHRPGVQPADG